MTIVKNWQTEAGTPNQLNIFIRQDATGKSIENIKAGDNDYRRDLQTLEEGIIIKSIGLKWKLRMVYGGGVDYLL